MSRRSKETLAVQLFPFLAVLVCTMGSLIFLLLVTTREIRRRAVAFAEFQQSQQLEQSLSKTPFPPSEAQDLPVRSIPKPEPTPTESLPTPIPEPVTPPDDGYDEALAQREHELSNLKASWRTKANLLVAERDHQRDLVARRTSSIRSAQQKIETLESTVKELEVELGRLAGETAAASQNVDENERILLEQQIALMKKRLRAAQVADATAQRDQFQVIPFDPQTGTTRRPILIECTAAGIRFLPEDILISADDLRGFTFKANPLAAGTGALINYWTALKMKQRQPQAEPEPYVLMLVRPEGVYAYYVAMKMLEPIRTAQGYELVEDSTVLKLPEVDAGAKAACQAAVDRLLSEREDIYRTAISGGSSGTVFGGNSGRNGTIGSQRGAFSRGTGESGRPGGNPFTMNDITGGDNAVGNRSWERVENFQGRHQGGPRRSGVMGGTGGRGEDSSEPFDGTSNGLGTAVSDRFEPGSLDGSTSDPRNSQADKIGKKGNPASGSPATGNGSSFKNGSFGSSASGGMEPEPGMPIGERPGRKSKRSNEDADGDGQLTDAEAGDDWEGTDGGEPGGTSRSRPSSAGSSSRISNNGSSGRFSHNPRNPTRAARPGEKPSKSDDTDKPLEPEMLAGRRWGACDIGASIGFEREVRVDVSGDKLVIAEKHVIPIGQGESKTETLERFATALDLCSREWGRPPQGFFWAPRLKFVVKPEGNGHYEQVNAMMTRAGLATSHEFAKDPNSIQFGRAAAATTTKPVPKTVVAPRSGGNQ